MNSLKKYLIVILIFLTVYMSFGCQKNDSVINSTDTSTEQTEIETISAEENELVERIIKIGEVFLPKKVEWMDYYKKMLEENLEGFLFEFLTDTTELNQEKINSADTLKQTEIVLDILEYFKLNGSDTKEIIAMLQKKAADYQANKISSDVKHYIEGIGNIKLPESPDKPDWQWEYGQLCKGDYNNFIYTFLKERTELSEDAINNLDEEQKSKAVVEILVYFNRIGVETEDLLRLYNDLKPEILALFITKEEIENNNKKNFEIYLANNELDTNISTTKFNNYDVIKDTNDTIYGIEQFQTFEFISSEELGYNNSNTPFVIIKDKDGVRERARVEYSGKKIILHPPLFGYRPNTEYTLAAAYPHLKDEDYSQYFTSIIEYKIKTEDFEYFHPDFKGNYIHPNNNGIAIITKIPDGIDAVAYYDSDDNYLIKTSDKSGEIIQYNTDKKLVNLKMVPVIDGKNFEQNGIKYNVNNEINKPNIHFLFDPYNSDTLTLSYYIPDKNSYEKIINDIGSKKLILLETIIEDASAYTKNGEKINIQNLGRLKKGEINEDNHGYSALKIDSPQFPLYLNLTVSSSKLIKGEDANIHIAKYTIYTEKDLLVALNASFIPRMRDMAFDIFLSIPEEMEGYSYKGQSGNEYRHTADRKTFYDVNSGGGIFISRFYNDIKKLDNHNFEVKFTWPSFMGTADMIFSKDFFEKTKFVYQMHFDNVYPLNYSEACTILLPQTNNDSVLDFPLHPTITVPPYSYPYGNIDVHGINRIWTSYSKDDIDNWWISLGGIADALYYIKSSVSGWNNWWISANNHNFFKVYFEDNLNNPKRFIPLNKWQHYRNEGRIGPDDYLWIRQSTIGLITVALDVLMYCTSDGNVIDLLKVWGDLDRNTPEGSTWKMDDFFEAAKKYTNYDFSLFQQKYLDEPAALNAAYIMPEENEYGYGVYAIGDYSDKRMEIKELGLKSFKLAGKAMQDTYILISLDFNRTLNDIKMITTNGSNAKIIPYYSLAHSNCIFVEKGEYEIEIQFSN